MKKPIRVGFVGARFAAKFHWEAIRRVYGVPVEIVGVTSKTPEARDAFARETGIKALATLDELCAAVDVVDLCTPPSSHEELAVTALGLGKHVIIEKPLTGYYGANASGFEARSFSKEQMLREATASCARILAAAKASGKRVCYAENWVYAPAIQKEREIIQKSGGQVLWMLGEQSHGGSQSPGCRITAMKASSVPPMTISRITPRFTLPFPTERSRISSRRNW
jgi:predicted dehydrogenase